MYELGRITRHKFAKVRNWYPTKFVDKLPTLSMPVLLIAGAHDEAFCQHARRMHELIGETATLHILEDAGHSVHLEQPAKTAEILSNWLATL